MNRDIDFLLNSLVDLLYLLRIAPYGNGILMNVLNATGRNIQALDINLSTSKYCGNLIKDTRNIL